jgi:hypothetical protein
MTFRHQRSICQLLKTQDAGRPNATISQRRAPPCRLRSALPRCASYSVRPLTPSRSAIAGASRRLPPSPPDVCRCHLWRGVPPAAALAIPPGAKSPLGRAVIDPQASPWPSAEMFTRPDPPDLFIRLIPLASSAILSPHRATPSAFLWELEAAAGPVKLAAGPYPLRLTVPAPAASVASPKGRDGRGRNSR